MRVSRVQAEVNHQRVVDEAITLFREHGYDGIGVKDLMKAAGLTQGGFYKQFASKEDLAVQATARGIENSTDKWSEIIDANPTSPLEALVAFYLSTDHRDSIGHGCPLAALGSDAARNTQPIRSAFETGIRDQLKLLDSALGCKPDNAPSKDALASLSMMLGALALSRLTNDRTLSESFLAAATERLLSPKAA